MKRITISVPEELAEAVEREARRRRVAVSEIVRQSLWARLCARQDGRPTLGFAGLGRSGSTDTARRAEEILAKEWGPQVTKGGDD